MAVATCTLFLLCLCAATASAAVGAPALTTDGLLRWLAERQSQLSGPKRTSLRNLTSWHAQHKAAQAQARRTPSPTTSRSTGAAPLQVTKPSFQAVIVGAGVSGLAAAQALIDDGMDPAEVLVLEASDRVGGRTHNIPVPGHNGRIVEAGGTWFSPTNTAALQLVERLGLETFNTYYNYPNCCDPNMTEPSVFPEPLDETAAVQAELARMSEQVPLDAPWMGPAEWDELSYCDWLHSLPGLSQPARQELNGAVFPYAATPCDPSLLYHLFVLRSAGGWRQLLGNRLGGQDLRLVKGSAELSTELAARLTARGVTIALSHQVLSLNISGSAGSVPITYMVAGDGAPSVIQAGAAIIAMSTPDANRVEYISASDPSDFPLQRRQLMSEVAGNPATKAFVLFEGSEAEWQRTGAQTIPALEGLMYDYSPLDGRPGLLMLFSDAKDDIERLIWDGLVRLLVSTLPGITQEIDEIIWYGWYPGAPAGDPTRWDTTGATTVMGPGTLSRLGSAWRAPIAQQLHWAGSDTSDLWSGYIEGGVRAGQRAAAEVLAQRETY